MGRVAPDYLLHRIIDLIRCEPHVETGSSSFRNHIRRIIDKRDIDTENIKQDTGKHSEYLVQKIPSGNLPHHTIGLNGSMTWMVLNHTRMQC